MKKNVLVFPCGSEIGLEIYRSVCFSTHFKLFGASSVDDHGRFTYEDYIGDLPMATDDDFIDRLNQVIAKHNIDLVMPAHDDAVVILAEAVAEGKLNCKVVGSPAETCKIARSKSNTYKKLRDTVRVPELFDPATLKETDLPVFIKPDRGQGSKGAYKIDSLEQLSGYLMANDRQVVTEFLPGEEYTIDCFTDRAGEVRYAEGRLRQRIMNGISVRSTREFNKQFREIAEKINKALRFRGAWFIQLKKSEDDELVLMEVAPRIAGTMALSRAYGVNLPLLSLFDALDMPVTISENNYDITIDRALANRFDLKLDYGHVYIDFDDVILRENKINTQVMAYLFQCMNQSKKIHLLSRHKKSLHDTLRERKLLDLFDEVIWVQDDTPKSKFIKVKDAIFVDDSFAERDEVQKTCKIPVFDLHMIETLMEE